jgi:hypothetical protein
LCDNDIHAGVDRTFRIHGRSHGMQHCCSSSLGALHQGARVSPEKRYDRHAFLKANFKTLLLGKFQVEIHAKWPGSKGTRLANLPPDIFKVCAPQRQHPQSPGVAHGSGESRPYGTAHWSLDDRELDTNMFAKPGLH